MSNNDFPIGFIKCLKCGKPALWLEKDTDLFDGCKLVNIKMLGRYDPEELGEYLCDNCEIPISDDNIASNHIYFLVTDTKRKDN